MLAIIGNKNVVKGSTLTFTATATDVDAGQTKTFSLVSAPSGATIGATSGTFSWTPSATGTFPFKVRVADNGSPLLYDEESITVTVSAPALTILTNPEYAVKPIDETHPIGATLYPNPVASTINITLNQPSDALHLKIIDAKGAVVYQHSYKGVGTLLQVPAQQLQPGMYMVLLQTTEGTQTLKFVKQ